MKTNRSVLAGALVHMFSNLTGSQLLSSYTTEKHIDVIPNWKQKNFVFDETAPYDCFSDTARQL